MQHSSTASAFFACIICGAVTLRSKPSDTRVSCSKKCGYKASGMKRAQLGMHPDHGERWKAVIQSQEHKKICSIAHKGKPMKTPKTSRFSSQHHKALCFFVKSPKNITYMVMNVRKFIVENETLFPPETTRWKMGKGGESCAASHGLCAIGTGRRGVWRGWMKVGNIEGKENIELLPRTFQEQKQ